MLCCCLFCCYDVAVYAYVVYVAAVMFYVYVAYIVYVVYVYMLLLFFYAVVIVVIYVVIVYSDVYVVVADVAVAGVVCLAFCALFIRMIIRAEFKGRILEKRVWKKYKI